MLFLLCMLAALAPPASTSQIGPAAERWHHRHIHRYLETVKHSLTGTLLRTDSLVPGLGNVSELQRAPFNATQREGGEDWPDLAYTMAGNLRLDNVRDLLKDCFRNNVHGDFVECGVWRGGSSIFAKAVIEVHEADKRVHVVDSFQGLPPAQHPIDLNIYLKMDYLKVPLEVVRGNFHRYGLLDDGVKFHKGFFNESVPRLRMELKSQRRSISVLRLDGDMYMSLTDCLYNLYELVSVGGFVIVDDWMLVEARKAVQDFFERHQLKEEILAIDKIATYWQKQREVVLDHAWYQDLLKNLSGVPARAF